MKNLDLLKAVGQIDEKYIEEADEGQVTVLRKDASVFPERAASERAAKRRRWISVAASLAVVAGIGAYAISGGFAGSKEFALQDSDANTARPDVIASNNTASSLPATTDKLSLPNKSVTDGDTSIKNQESAVSELVVMAVEELDNDACEAKILVSNNLDVDIIFGEEFHILKEDKNSWKELPLVNDRTGWDMKGYPVKPGAIWSSTVNWKNVYGILGSGRYRLVKLFRVDGQDGNNACACDLIIE